MPKERITLAGKTITLESSQVEARIRALVERQEAFMNAPPEVKNYDPDLDWCVRPPGEGRVCERWRPSGASSGSTVHYLNYFGLTICTSVPSGMSYERHVRESRPDYLKEYGAMKR